ncbi:MAG: hypothetical protein R3E08_02345 [Thiotrichaceae bacterium]
MRRKRNEELLEEKRKTCRGDDLLALKMAKVCICSSHVQPAGDAVGGHGNKAWFL